MRAWLLGGMLLATSALPSAAAAFSDYDLFAMLPLEGGGGGRFFTASTSDGYGCGVCHLGGVKPFIQLRGLPQSEYLPGTSYDVELAWASPQFPHALNLEFVTPQGNAAGTITLPAPSSLQAADLCSDAELGGKPATQLIEESAPRQVLWVNDCGAQRVRFRFTAPADTQLMFAAAVVRSDKSGKPSGDGVTELRRELYRVGAPRPASSGCAVTEKSGELQVTFVALVAAFGALIWRRRRAADS